MKLYFSPLACSLATRIALYEAGAGAEYIEVDPKTKQTPDGQDFRQIHSLGLVPALRMDNGELLTENAAILQQVARCFPEAELAPRDAPGTARLQQWLCYIGTELHKGLYVPLLDSNSPAEMKRYVLTKAESRLRWVEERVSGREYLLEKFSVADAYLFTVLNWSLAAPVDLKPWAAISGYMDRLRTRPSVKRALTEEKELYVRERARHATSESARAPAPAAAR